MALMASPNAPRRPTFAAKEHSMKISTVSVQVRFSDVDMAHHVHNAVYLQWFEQARMAYQERFIPPGHDWSTQGFILARNEVDYRMPVRLGDAVEAEAWCSAIGNRSFDLRYAVRRTNGERPGVCAEGRSVMVCYDFKNGRTIDLPNAWRAVLEQNLIA